MQRYPYYRDAIQYATDKGFIRIVVYGDNHIACFPKALRDILNVESFGNFLSKICDMQLRDQREFDVFLSVPNLATGGLSARGPVFLKRYFILNNDGVRAKVLPYKPITETMLRALACEETEAPLGLVLKCIGQAWDTQGTNRVAYDCINNMYGLLVRSGEVKTPREMLDEYLKRPDGRVKINKIMRRLGMREDEIFSRFPSLKMLNRRHVYVPGKCRFGGPSTIDELKFFALTS